jgi:hypothetical protein
LIYVIRTPAVADKTAGAVSLRLERAGRSKAEGVDHAAVSVLHGA